MELWLQKLICSCQFILSLFQTVHTHTTDQSPGSLFNRESHLQKTCSSVSGSSAFGGAEASQRHLLTTLCELFPNERSGTLLQIIDSQKLQVIKGRQNDARDHVPFRFSFGIAVVRMEICDESSNVSINRHQHSGVRSIADASIVDMGERG